MTDDPAAVRLEHDPTADVDLTEHLTARCAVCGTELIGPTAYDTVACSDAGLLCRPCYLVTHPGARP